MAYFTSADMDRIFAWLYLHSVHVVMLSLTSIITSDFSIRDNSCHDYPYSLRLAHIAYQDALALSREEMRCLRSLIHNLNLGLGVSADRVNRCSNSRRSV